MGGVDFSYLVPPGNNPVLNFSDTWIGADRPFFMGNNWAMWITQDNAVAGVDMAAQINLGASGLTYGNGSGVNLNAMYVPAVPANVNRPAIVQRVAAGNIQFAEFKLVAKSAGIDCGLGPAVLLNPGDAAGYFIQIESINTNTQLLRKNTALGSTSIRANCFTNALNDVIRMEARIVGGFPEIKVYQNGVLKSTDVDNSGLGPTSGQYGIVYSGVFTGTLTVSNFNGGQQ